jgi:histidine ammonia-lyase
MGANAATKLLRVVGNTKNVLAIEWLCAIGALNQRSEKSSPEIEKMRASFAELGPNIHQTTPMQELIEKAYAFLWG